MADLDHGLLSPARSDGTTTHSETLPITRAHPLQPGSSKETTLINYLDSQLLHITERYAKSAAPSSSNQTGTTGYASFDEVILDLDKVLDVVWISGTPHLQIPYLLTLAGHFRDFMHSFPFATTSFQLVRKLDTAFTHLLTADDAQNKVTPTDKVRIKSLAEETRVEMAQVASKEGHSVVSTDTFEDEEDVDDDEDDPSSQSIGRRLGKVYESTLQILGAGLRSLPTLQEQPSDDPFDQIMDDTEVIEL